MKYFLTILTFILFVNCIAQTQKAITGFIQDKTGNPLDAVTVIIKGTSLGTATDASGHFTFNQLSVNAVVLECSKIGYETQLITVQLNNAQTTSLHIVLSEQVTSLRSVTVYSNKNVLNPVEQLGDENQGHLLAGKKNGVINISNANSNLSTKIGRELFAKIPGVFVYDMDGSGNQVNISTRGLDPHRSWEYNVRQNGVLLNSDMYGYPASHYSAPMESIEKVEMISGTAALQYGAQFGGLINYVTKSADSGKAFSFENLSTAGSFGLFSTYNAVGGHVGKWSYYAYLSKRVANGYRKNSESNAVRNSLRCNTISRMIYI